MTNGEKIKEIFPSTDSRLDEKTGIMLVKWVDGATKCFKADWWNSEYKEPTTKNDLGVDLVSRAEVNQVIEDYMDEQYHVLSDRTRERAFGAKVVMARINELPSVTPQEPFINKPCVSEKQCEHDKQKVLDKIRAEIKNKIIKKPNLDFKKWERARNEAFLEILDIIDKYKGESEET